MWCEQWHPRSQVRQVTGKLRQDGELGLLQYFGVFPYLYNLRDKTRIWAWFEQSHPLSQIRQVNKQTETWWGSVPSWILQRLSVFIKTSQSPSHAFGCDMNSCIFEVESDELQANWDTMRRWAFLNISESSYIYTITNSGVPEFEYKI